MDLIRGVRGKKIAEYRARAGFTPIGFVACINALSGARLSMSGLEKIEDSDDANVTARVLQAIRLVLAVRGISVTFEELYHAADIGEARRQIRESIGAKPNPKRAQSSLECAV